jgi:hypothetical protein
MLQYEFHDDSLSASQDDTCVQKTELQSLYEAANTPESMKTKYKPICNGNINIHLTKTLTAVSALTWRHYEGKVIIKARPPVTTDAQQRCNQ